MGMHYAVADQKRREAAAKWMREHPLVSTEDDAPKRRRILKDDRSPVNLGPMYW